MSELNKGNEKRRRIFFKCCRIFNIVAVILVIGLFLIFLYMGLAMRRDNNQSPYIDQYAESSTTETPKSIIIPTVDDIRANGYPTNENGETYGPEVWESTDPPPDLILVIADDGQDGYVKKTDMDSDVTTPEEAANYKPGRRVLNVYLHDGTTVIGTFTLGGD